MNDLVLVSLLRCAIQQPVPAPVLCEFIWAVLGMACVMFIGSLKHGIEHVQQLHRVPCDRCKFFTGDYRLKCPVHPCTACTLDAIDCRDFESEALPHNGVDSQIVLSSSILPRRRKVDVRSPALITYRR